jgi:energy-coupling factor transporter ATP-binding protein EcfA2
VSGTETTNRSRRERYAKGASNFWRVVSGVVATIGNVSGWGNIAGIAYQQAHAVLACLEMLDAVNGQVISVKVESGQDVFDLELYGSSGELVASRQIKTRALDRTWAQSDIYPLVRRWDESEHPDGARFELRLGGRPGPSAEALVGALRAAEKGDISRLTEQAGDNLNAAQIEAARFVDVIIDPTPTAALLTAGTQQALAFLPGVHTGSDAIAEADSTMGRLYRLVMQRAACSDESDRVVTRTDVLELFGLTEKDLGGRWDEVAAADYLQTVGAQVAPTTVDIDLRRQQTPIERATSTDGGEVAELANFLESDSHVLLAGQSGSGKSTAALTLRALAANSGRAVVLVNAEAYIPGRLAYLVCNALSSLTRSRTPLQVGQGILSDPTAVLVLDGVAEMPAAGRDALASELGPYASDARGCVIVLIGRDAAILNSVLPHYVSKRAYVLRGIKPDRRDELVADVVRPLGITDDYIVRRVSARAGYALKSAANVPYLLRMAAELIARGFDIHGRAQMYSVFTQEIAQRKGLVDLQFCLLALGMAFSELLDHGHRQCDQFDWRQLLHRATQALHARNIDITVARVESSAREGGLVAYEDYDQIVRPVHDSLADFFAALAHNKGLSALPQAVTENDELRLRFLAEMSGVDERMGALVTQCIPLSAVELSKFDNQAIGATTPGQAAHYLHNLLADTALGQPTVQISTAPDGRSFGFLSARDTSETIAPEQIYTTGAEYGLVEVAGGPLSVAVALWKAKLNDLLEHNEPGWPIPSTAEDAAAALTRHRGQTMHALQQLIRDGFPPSCRNTLLNLAQRSPLDVVIRPVIAEAEPWWPMYFRPAQSWRVSIGDFAEWSQAGSHTGWGSVDSTLRVSPSDTAKTWLRGAVNELADNPWLT